MNEIGEEVLGEWRQKYCLSRICGDCCGTGREVNHGRLGEMMKGKRLKAGLTQKSVSKGMGVSQPYVNDLESGRRAWNFKLVKGYLEACGLIFGE